MKRNMSRPSAAIFEAPLVIDKIVSQDTARRHRKPKHRVYTQSPSYGGIKSHVSCRGHVCHMAFSHASFYLAHGFSSRISCQTTSHDPSAQDCRMLRTQRSSSGKNKACPGFLHEHKLMSRCCVCLCIVDQGCILPVHLLDVLFAMRKIHPLSVPPRLWGFSSCMAATAVSATGLLGWKQPARMGRSRKIKSNMNCSHAIYDVWLLRLANRGSKDSLSTRYFQRSGQETE